MTKTALLLAAGLYLLTAAGYARVGNFAMCGAFVSYALANVCFAWSAP